MPFRRCIKWQCISIHALAKRATQHSFLFNIQFHDFNPRPREEGDAVDFNLLVTCSLFQSTPSRRGRPQRRKAYNYCKTFQSTPSRRGRLHRYAQYSIAALFQSTPSRRGRPTNIRVHADVVDFNPRPREEGDVNTLVSIVMRWGISIHALAKRATSPFHGIERAVIISIHALAKRATLRRCWICGPFGYFNPRPREEGDYLRQSSRFSEIFQSTPSRRGRLSAQKNS